MQMDRVKLEQLKSWFEDYVAGYYSDDAALNENISLKHVHTHKVCKEMELLCRQIGLNEYKTDLAMAIALLHDVGRFEQLKQFKTFNDRISMKHADQSIETIREHEVLANLSEDEQIIIETAIKHHSDKELSLLPAQENALIFAHLIRDADKIDIYRVIVESYRKYKENPHSCSIAIGFMDDGDGKCSPEVIDCILNHKIVTYDILKNQNDRKLLQINWVYQMHFDHALRTVLERGYINLFFDNLPMTQEILQVRETISDYIDKRLGTKNMLDALSA